LTLPANKTQRIATELIRYDIPGIGNADLKTILKIRQNEDAFEAFRIDFGDLIDRVHQEQPVDQREFEKEFRQAADDILRPRVEEVNKTFSVSFIEKTLVPAALSVGAGVVVYVSEESHRGIVPMNHSNKDGTSSAESEEGRLRIKENTLSSDTYPTPSGTARVPRVGECAEEHYARPLFI
jgi:hypothetical protein